MNEARVLLTKAWEIETALRLVGVKIRKAKYDNLLTAEGFDDAVIQMLNELQKAVVPEEQKALEALLEELNAAWVVMPAELRTAVLEEAARKYLGLTKHIPEIAVDVLKIETKHVVGNTRQQVIDAHELPRISASLSLEDARITEAVAERQAHYVKDQYGRRVESHSKFAREEVAKGFKEGFDPETIAKDLKKSMEARDVKRSADYWEMVSSTYCARSRSYGELSSFADAGIDEFEFEAVLDEVTSLVCRFLHGKRFSVRNALNTFQRVADSKDPERVKVLQPWVQNGKEDGEEFLYYRDENGDRVKVADIVQSGVGMIDDVGEFTNGMDREALEAAGITTPPLHGRCRSTLVPVFD